MGMYDFIGSAGDTGVILGGYYRDPLGRVLICMTDHADNGIYLDIGGEDY